MSLIKRLEKGAPLTNLEGDENLEYLEGLAQDAKQTLAEVLSEGNSSGANNIVVSDGQTINAATGNGQLDLRNNDNDDFLRLGFDFNSGLLLRRHTDLELSSGIGTGEFMLSSQSSSINGYVVNSGIIGGESNSIEGTSEDFTSNSLVLGGTGITANLSNTVFTPDIKIQQGKFISGSDNNTGTYMSSDDGMSYAWTAHGYAAIADYSGPGAYTEVGSTDTVGIYSGEFTIEMLSNALKISGLPTYADNAAATTGGLPVDAVYKTAGGELRIVV